MANEATAELYTKQSGLNKAKLKTDYKQYLADLASQYGLSTKQLNANLEARGILRSGEAGTARTRLSAAEEAARLSAKSDYDYNLNTEDVDLMKRLASLQAGSAGSGGSRGSGGGTTPPPGDSLDPAPMYRSPADPMYDSMRNRGPRPSAPSVRPVRDALPRTPRLVANMPRPGTPVRPVRDTARKERFG